MCECNAYTRVHISHLLLLHCWYTCTYGNSQFTLTLSISHRSMSAVSILSWLLVEFWCPISSYISIQEDNSYSYTHSAVTSYTIIVLWTIWVVSVAAWAYANYLALIFKITTIILYTVDWEIFVLNKFRKLNFRMLNSRICLILRNF